MRFFYCLPILLLQLALTGSASAARYNVDLPKWEAAGEAAKYRLGGGLWPGKGPAVANANTEEGGTTTKTGENQSVLIPNEAEVEEKILSSDADAETAPKPNPNGPTLEKNPIFYGPDGEVSPNFELKIENPSVPALPPSLTDMPLPPAMAELLDPTPALPPIEGELRNRYFLRTPDDFLVDPQGFLTEQKSNDLRRFLEFHAEEAEFHIYVFVLGDTQKVPIDIDLQSLHSRWFGESPTALMIYQHERPRESQFVYNDGMKKLLPESVFDRIRQNCLREGEATDNASDQVEKMSVELSIQLFWLAKLSERQLQLKTSEAGGGAHQSGNSGSDAPAVESPAVTEALRQNDKSAPVVIIEDEGGRTRLSILLFWPLAIIGSLTVLAAIGWVALWWWKRDSLRGKPVLFPDCEVSHRLGGTYSGGGFVGMSFDASES